MGTAYDPQQASIVPEPAGAGGTPDHHSHGQVLTSGTPRGGHSQGGCCVLLVILGGITSAGCIVK